MNKKGKDINAFISGLLIVFIVLCQIFRYKTIYIETNNVLEVSLSNIIYPFTFLFIILINNKTNFKESHKLIIKSIVLYLLFMLFISMLNSIPGNYYGREVDLALKEVFTPNHFMIGDKIFYYPNLLNLFSFSLLFYFSHTLLIVLYEAMENYTNKFASFALSMFIPYTLDVICFVTLENIFKEVELNTLITNLTSNFVIVIIFTIVITFIYCITKAEFKKR